MNTINQNRPWLFIALLLLLLSLMLVIIKHHHDEANELQQKIDNHSEIKDTV